MKQKGNMQDSVASETKSKVLVTRRSKRKKAGSVEGAASTVPVTSDEKILSVLARKVRSLRTSAGLTLQQVAARSGVSQSALSKIENGQLSPTYERIVTLASGLGVEPAELFSESPLTTPVGRRGITRSGQGVRHSTPQYDYQALCADISGKAFLPLHTVIKAHSLREFSALARHSGAEFVYVVSGKLTLHTEFYEPLTLLPGDSVYYDSAMGHALVSEGNEDAVILWVCSDTPPLDKA